MPSRTRHASSSRLVTAAALSLALAFAAGCKRKQPNANVNPGDWQARKAAHQPFTPPPAVKRNLYPPPEQAETDVHKALAEAKATHKRVLLDFGGDWCGDCQVLDIYFHQAPNDKLLADHFIKVNVNIGREDANLDLAHRYGVPIHGVPALAVLDPEGNVLYAQDKEFSDMRYMEPVYVTDFLNKWKG